MKSCHLSSAYRAPDTTPNTFPASLLWCLDNVVKKGCSPQFSVRKTEGHRGQIPFPKPWAEQVAELGCKPEFLGLQIPFCLKQRLASAERARRTPRGKISPPGKRLPTEEGRIDGEEAERWAGGTSPSYTHCGERKERLPRRQPQLFHSASIRRWKMTTT